MAYLAVKDGRAAVAPSEPAVGDLLVRGLGEVDAVPAEVRGGAGARGRALHPAPGAVLVVVLAAARPAARLEHRAEPCNTHQEQANEDGRLRRPQAIKGGIGRRRVVGWDAMHHRYLNKCSPVRRHECETTTIMHARPGGTSFELHRTARTTCSRFRVTARHGSHSLIEESQLGAHGHVWRSGLLVLVHNACFQRKILK